MKEKEKLRMYLDYKRVSKNAFCKEMGLSVGFLDSGDSFGADKIKTIIQRYPDLSLKWLVLDEGPMLVENVEKSGVYINGNNQLNNSTIDNRHYNSDSPDIAQFSKTESHECWGRI